MNKITKPNMRPPKQIAAKNVNETVLKIFKRLIKGKENLKLLNIACGEGYLEYLVLKEFGKEFFIKNEWHAIDINIEQFKLKQFPIKLIRHDANEKLPFPDRYFDIVISVETIEHLKRPIDFLEELARVLKKNMYLILTTPNTVNIFDRLQFLLYGELWYYNSIIKDHIAPQLPHILFSELQRYFNILKVYCNNCSNKYYRNVTKFRIRGWKILLTKILLPFIINNFNKRLLYHDALIFLLVKK